MITGLGYIYKQNVVMGSCTYCGDLTSSLLADPLIMKCSCRKENLGKPPLYFLTTTNLTMITFSLRHESGKEYIGTIITRDHDKIDQKIEDEVKYIRDFRNFGVDPTLKKDLKDLDNFTWSKISVSSTLAKAMIDEKLEIMTRNTLSPNGYNTMNTIETLIKTAKK